MNLHELSDQQIAAANVGADPTNQQQLNQPQVKQQAQRQHDDAASTDPLRKRLSQLRQQVAQIMLQIKQRDAKQAKTNLSRPALGTTAPGTPPPAAAATPGAPVAPGV